MLAEYLTLLPTATGSTNAVRTGTGRVSAASCCLHAVDESNTMLVATLKESSNHLRVIGSLLAQRLLKGSLCIPESKQALFIVMIRVGDRGFLLQQIAHKNRRMLELIMDLSQLLVRRIPGSL